jgi:hypothetical protein
MIFFTLTPINPIITATTGIPIILYRIDPTISKCRRRETLRVKPHAGQLHPVNTPVSGQVMLNQPKVFGIITFLNKQGIIVRCDITSVGIIASRTSIVLKLKIIARGVLKLMHSRKNEPTFCIG